MKKYIALFFILIVILTCSSVCYAGTFYDIIDTKYEGVVEGLAFLKIVDGVSEHVFDANKIVTRAELAKMLVISFGYNDSTKLIGAKKAFKDVKEGSWYYDYVNIAAAYGFLNGYPDGNFYPDREVTYAETVAMILRGLGHKYVKEDSEYGWYYNYIERMRDLKLNKGIEVFYNEKGAKRGDVAILIWNMLNQHTWEVIKEEGKAELTYADSGKVLLNKAFEKKYELVNDKKLKDLFSEDGELYANVEGYSKVKLANTLPVKAIGSKITGVYNIEEKTLVVAIYDMDITIVEGYAEELKEDGYKIKSAKSKYSFGGKDVDYAFLAIKEEDGKKEIERAITIDLDGKILIDEIKKEKDEITINESITIDTNKAILIDGKEVIKWSELSKEDSILLIGSDLYMLANDYKSEDEKKEENKNINGDDNLYYIIGISYGTDKTYLRIAKSEKSNYYSCSADIGSFEIGDFVMVTFENNVITKISKADSKEYENLKNGKQLILNYKKDDYAKGMIGKHIINQDTEIFFASKKYKNNSDTLIEKCILERVDEEELQFIDNENINIITDGTIAKVIYIERNANKFSVFYARVKDVKVDKDKIFIDILPINSAIKKYKTTGRVDCEAGDIISYTLSGKEGEQELRIDEVYHTSAIGYKGDLIVESVKDKVITLTNGEKFNQTNNVIHINNKDYKLSKYIIIRARVRQAEDGWVFSSAEFVDFKKVRLSPGDRIAIDEIEGAIVIYYGYDS